MKSREASGTVLSKWDERALFCDALPLKVLLTAANRVWALQRFLLLPLLLHLAGHRAFIAACLTLDLLWIEFFEAQKRGDGKVLGPSDSAGHCRTPGWPPGAAQETGKKREEEESWLCALCSKLEIFAKHGASLFTRPLSLGGWKSPEEVLLFSVCLVINPTVHRIRMWRFAPSFHLPPRFECLSVGSRRRTKRVTNKSISSSLHSPQSAMSHRKKARLSFTEITRFVLPCARLCLTRKTDFSPVMVCFFATPRASTARQFRHVSNTHRAKNDSSERIMNPALSLTKLDMTHLYLRLRPTDWAVFEDVSETNCFQNIASPNHRRKKWRLETRSRAENKLLGFRKRRINYRLKCMSPQHTGPHTVQCSALQISTTPKDARGSNPASGKSQLHVVAMPVITSPFPGTCFFHVLPFSGPGPNAHLGHTGAAPKLSLLPSLWPLDESWVMRLQGLVSTPHDLSFVEGQGETQGWGRLGQNEGARPYCQRAVCTLRLMYLRLICLHCRFSSYYLEILFPTLSQGGAGESCQLPCLKASFVHRSLSSYQRGGEASAKKDELRFCLKIDTNQIVKRRRLRLSVK